MRHLKHILAVVVPIVTAAATTLAVSPAVQNFAGKHPGVVVYVLLAAGVASAIVKAILGESSSSVDAPGPGASSMSAR